MVNQTEFVDNLKKRMNISIENNYYLESITCSYAIIENRIQRILLHLNIPLKKVFMIIQKVFTIACIK